MPAHLKESLPKNVEDCVVVVKNRCHRCNYAEATFPDLCNPSAKVSSELTVMDLTQLPEYCGAFISAHGEDGGEVLDQKNTVSSGRMNIAVSCSFIQTFPTAPDLGSP